MKDGKETARRAGAAEATGQGADLRCGCGALLARQTSAGIELKCRRCRRCVLLRVQPDGSVIIDQLPEEPSPPVTGQA